MRPPAAAGRCTRHPSPPSRRSTASRCSSRSVPATPRSSSGCTEIAPDCCPVVAYGALVPRAALGIPRHGWVNLHFSLLPAWRGAAPVQHAIWHGDDVTGATTFLLEEGLDTGPVLGVVTETVRPADTSGDLLEPAVGVGAGLLVATMDALDSGIMAAARQPADGVSLAPKITVDDARGRLVPARRPRRPPGPRVHAGPGCVDDVRPASGSGSDRWPLLADDTSLAPGELGGGQGPRCGSARPRTPCALGEVQRRRASKAMAAADWARGARPAAGARLGA